MHATVEPRPDHAEHWFREGERRLELARGADTQSEYRDDLTGAVAAFEQALARDPRHPGALRHRALALARLERHEEAVDGLVAATVELPGDVELWRSMGQCLAALGRPEHALHGFERALALAADDGEARFGRAQALTALGRDALALEAWDAVLGAGDLRAMNLNGQPVHVLTDDFRRAQARLARARCLERLGHAGARADFALAFEAEGPKLPIARQAFVQALRESPAARAAYRDYLAPRASEAGAWFRAVDAYRAAGLLDEARAACEVLVRLEPANAQAWFSRAETHAVLDEVDEAEAAYRRALELWPQFLAARARLTALLERR